MTVTFHTENTEKSDEYDNDLSYEFNSKFSNRRNSENFERTSQRDSENFERTSQRDSENYERKSEICDRFSYKVVGRLSRWEGNSSSPYCDSVRHNGVEWLKPEKITLWQFFRQFLTPTYDLTEVTVEDIERVKLMHDRFLNDAQFSFNYSTLLVIASVIAAVGLAVNSSASIIASMLVSPLMGPVTAISYGISIGDYKMVRMAAVTEIFSLVVCVIIGVVVASCMLSTTVADRNWPSEEMTSRGSMTNFYAGIPIAFFSGFGVAVGLLDSQTNSLVGVAISASLLPPAVNAGMLWIIEHAIGYDVRQEGTISLLLTIMNIGVIIVASMLMFRLKETLPIEKSIFWSDLGVARKIYHNVAIVPNFQEAPDDKEIEKRVLRFFPRCSEMGRMRPSVFAQTRDLQYNESDTLSNIPG